VSLFIMSLLSKPMAVTLPFVFLLLDYWPLKRSCTLKRHALEIIPLLGLSSLTGALTIMAQSASGSVINLNNAPLVFRVNNSLVSYATYLWKTVCPIFLSVYYPHPFLGNVGIPIWKLAGAIALLGSISYLAFRQRRERPFLVVGWLWYLGTLVPAIGLVQVGGQAMADRYTYLPLIGIFIMMTWGVPSWLENLRPRRIVLKTSLIVLFMGLTLMAWIQASYWRDRVTLLTHSLAVTPNNWFVMNALGNVFLENGQYQEAIRSCEESVRIYPDYWEAWHNMATAYMILGEYRKAIPCYQKALQTKYSLVDAWYKIGLAYTKLGEPDRAIPYYRETIRLNPDFFDAWQSLGQAYDRTGQAQKAGDAFRKADSLKGSSVATGSNR
jgi:protein O-mannosyl-transferase